MTYLKFDVKVTTHVTREPDPDDRWDNGCSDGTVEILSCRLAEQDVYDGLTASFDVVAGDTVWLVWAQYSTGDSFGSYGGSYELCSVFESQEKAETEVKRLKNVTDYSVPWNGYFENLDEIQAQPMKVLP